MTCQMLYEFAPLRFGGQFAMLLDSNNTPIEFNSVRGEFILDHNTEYSIVIGNLHETLKATVEIEIDDDYIGAYVIPPNDVRKFERGEMGQKLKFIHKKSHQGTPHKTVSNRGRGRIIIEREIPLVPPLDYLEYENECCAGGTVFNVSPEIEYGRRPKWNTEEVCDCLFWMGLRPAVIPQANDDPVPFIEIC